MNRLCDQTSPYLLQHADNPVHWQPWDEQALALAKRENKPILLSIGYSSNHMCRVMARESFESTLVARLMNENYVSIKVDREERPDIDRVYQTTHQLLNRKPGGWPLTMFLDPNDLMPIYAGTYFPPQPNHDAPAFRDVLKGMAETYGLQNEKMKEFKEKLTEALTPIHAEPSVGEFDEALVDRACGQIDASFDARHGGFSEAPKYPHATGLALMLDAAACIGDEAKSARLFHMLDFTLQSMTRSGLYDHLAGGFHRYAVDAAWNIPSFDKTLCDNALLLSIYAQRADNCDSQWMRDAANQTADWLMQEMQIDSGGFCSNLDGDNDGQEGDFYTWSYDELKAILGDHYEAFAEPYGLNKEANFKKNWHLRLSAPQETANNETVSSELAPARALLLAARKERGESKRDDKILTSWNGLTIRALADAARYLGREDCIVSATRAIDFLRDKHWVDGRLLAISRDGKAQLNAYIGDYAYLIDGLLAVLAVRWRDQDLAFALEVANAMLTHFEDSKSGGFYFTSHDHEMLIQRTKPFGDDSLPSGNGSAVRVLLELGHLSGEKRFTDAAEKALRSSMRDAERWPSAHATLMRGLLDFMQPAERIILRCGDTADTSTYTAAARAKLSARARLYVVPTTAVALPAGLAIGCATGNAAITAYVCRGHVSSNAANNLDEFEKLLDP
ncbi:MAG: hypothetical protein ACI9BW_002227 [Gammaproteobacteria bacterium]|jgi:uncharacterized protein YyaL (SSP411 family)